MNPIYQMGTAMMAATYAAAWASAPHTNTRTTLKATAKGNAMLQAISFRREREPTIFSS